MLNSIIKKTKKWFIVKRQIRKIETKKRELIIKNSLFIILTNDNYLLIKKITYIRVNQIKLILKP